MAFGKAIGAEALDLVETAPGEGRVVAALDHPADHPILIGVQGAVASERPHGFAQTVGLAVRELSGDHGDLHRLFLEQRHAQGLLQHLLQLVLGVLWPRLGVVRQLQPVAATQIGMDHVALDRAGPDDGDLDHQIIEAARLQPGQHVDLGAAFDLEDADGVAPAQHVVDAGIVGGDRMQRPVPALMGADQVEGLADAGQHAQRQHIDLHQAQFVDVVLVPLDEGAVGHGGVADGDQFVQPVLGQDEAADVLGQMPGKAQQQARHRHRPPDHRIGWIQPRLFDMAVADLRAPTAPLAGGQTSGDVLGQAKRLAHVADGALGAVADDGGGDAGALTPITGVDVLDDLLAPLVLEVDVDVGRLAPVRRQEALEQQVGFRRVHRRDAQHITDG